MIFTCLSIRLFAYLQTGLGVNRCHYNETVLTLTLKAECVSITIDHGIVVDEETVVMLDFYFKLKFKRGDLSYPHYINKGIRKISDDGSKDTMVESDLRKILCNFQNMQAQVQIWQCCLEYDDDSPIKLACNRQLLQISIINYCLSILSEQERFVVEYRLIYRKKWEDIYLLSEEKWGTVNGYSIRTMKRKQYIAIKKMLEFVHSTNLDSYFGSI